MRKIEKDCSNKLKISLLLSVHNVQDVLPQCLNSFLKQTEKNFELLIFDNASTDGTYPIMQVYQKKDSRIKIFHNNEEESKGLVANKLLQKAKGEITAFVSLSVFKEDFLHYAYHKIMAKDYDMLILEDKKSKQSRGPDGVYENTEEKKSLLSLQLARHDNIFYKTSFIKEQKIIFSDTEFGADFAFYISSVASAKKICCISKDFEKERPSIQYFTLRELKCFRQFGIVLQYCEKVLKQKRLWNSVEVSYIESMYIYVRSISEKIPYPIKYFWFKFLIDELPSVLDIRKFERKAYNLPHIFQWFHELKLKTYPSETFEKAFFERKQKVVTVVVAAEDDRDAMLTDITIQSIIDNASAHNFYNIYVLERGNISGYIRETIEKESRDNVFISFLNVSDYLPKNVNIGIYKTSSLYFLIPDILPLSSKAIYLKNNVLVMQDIVKLNEMNTHDMPISGVCDYADNEYVENELKLINETYVNDNVLLLDISQCLKSKFAEKFVKQISSSEKIYTSQDVLNVCCKDKINLLDPRCNCKEKIFSEQLLIKDYPQRLDELIVLNYTYIPNNNLFGEFSDIWWKYARMSFFYGFFLANYPRKMNSEYKYEIKKLYIKHYFLQLFSFGKKAQAHKDAMKKILSLLAEEN